MKTHLIPLLLLLTVLSGCLKEDDLHKPFASFAPPETDDGWEVVMPSEVGMDSLQLAEIFRDIHQNKDYWMVRSMLVFRNGKLVAESYTKDEADRTNPHAIWSCTKQVLGILAGIALDQDAIASVDEPISTYLPEETATHPDKKSITLHNLLRMQSGIGWSNDGASGQTDKLLRQLPDHLLDYILDRPKSAEQGTAYHYQDCDPHVVSAILQKQLGKPTDEWAAEVLFSKLGIQNWEWRRYKDGTTLGGYGLLMTPRELGKIAQCVLDKGKKGSETIVSESWINLMLSPHSPNAENGSQMGYYWWIEPNRHLYYMNGHGGQYAFIHPEKKLIVVTMSEPNTQDKYQFQTEEAFKVVDRVLNTIQ